MRIQCKSLAVSAALFGLLFASAAHRAKAEQPPSMNDAAVQAEIEKALRDGTTDDTVVLEAARRALTANPSEIDSVENILRNQMFSMVKAGLLSLSDVDELDALIKEAKSRGVDAAEFRKMTQPILDERLKHHLNHSADKECRTESLAHVPHVPEQDGEDGRRRPSGRYVVILELIEFLIKLSDC
jgi:hypothetical protein